jgi:hypothetical protein
MKKIKTDGVSASYSQCMTPAQKRFARWFQYQKVKEGEAVILRMLTNHELACIYDRIWDAMVYNNEQFVWDRDSIFADAESAGVEALRIIDKEAKRRKL